MSFQMGFITEGFATNITNDVFGSFTTMKCIDVFSNFFLIICKGFRAQSTGIKPLTIMILRYMNLILQMGSEFGLTIYKENLVPLLPKWIKVEHYLYGRIHYYEISHGLLGDDQVLTKRRWNNHN